MAQPRKGRIDVVSRSQAGKLPGRIQSKIDDFQLNRKWAAFPYAVQKKYSQDQAGNLGALITYYAFLSLFPLLVAVLSLAQLSLLKSAGLKSRIITALNNYIPVVGQQLQNHVHAQQKAGIALVISALLTIYGARGVANALQQAINHVWQVPKALRSGGIKAILRSLSIIFIGGFGFIVSGFLSSLGTHSVFWLECIAQLVSLIIVFATVVLLFKLSLSPDTNFHRFTVGSGIAAVGFQIVQAAGGYIVTHELKHFNSLYGSFGLVFVLLFWIYLQVRILMYAAEIDTVRVLRLWPRSLTGFRLTPADRVALKMYAGRETYIAPPKENVGVNFQAED